METLHQPEDIINQRYRIVALLGQGAMGSTYEAEDLTNYQRVAIKSLSLRGLQDWKTLELFEREAKVLANLNHPAIPKYLNYFQVDTSGDRRFYLIQELVTGDSLANLVKKGWHADEEIAKDILKQILEILQYLHSLKPPVIHRDIKPQNIIRRPDGRVYLVDFGAVQDVYRNTLTRGGTFVGTVGYIAPEQFRGEAQPASDLYALGATGIFLLTHRSPDDLPQKRLKIDFRDRINVSPQFAHWLEKMLEPAIEDRCQSATEAMALLSEKEIVAQVERGRSLSRSQGGRYRQPAGGKVLLHRTPTELVLEIFGFIDVNKLRVSSGITIITLFTIISLLLLNEFLGAFCIILLIGLIILILKKSPARLEMNSESFRCQWYFLGFRREVSGSTTNIYSVKMLENSQFFQVFGTKLTSVEKDWLAAEIAHFLKLPHNSRRRLG